MDEYPVDCAIIMLVSERQTVFAVIFWLKTMQDMYKRTDEWPFGTIQAHNYKVVLIDPPWAFSTFSQKGWGKAPQKHYSCMSLADIQSLPVSKLAHPDGCSLILWATAPMMPQALETMKMWDFAFKTMGAWAKQSSSGKKWAFGTGFVYRSAAEFWLYGTRGKPKQKVHNVRNLIIAPLREHSRKPDLMRSDIEALWDGPYCELFARERAPGWDSWGFELDMFNSR